MNDDGDETFCRCNDTGREKKRARLNVRVGWYEYRTGVCSRFGKRGGLCVGEGR